ncbi:MAG: hypothetical protein RBS76_00620 [Acholeplasmatales bacterium]|jgi:hypothetical protein|nr:hypothetical protein [Acholeplasmataceae bacterium]MDY0114982.1 hypothetical protein [Acholeplasmatales bacterium]MCK9234299.1 hypothetical protein [Acholeplasmataceae bacterium]MCK9288984.1 hypothetical protein [Acholeplasmataceae bacterium]MCK9427880.1 hypothetical protein [Acholeplasmataceae bacterium]
MKKFINWMDGNSKVLKVVLAIPLLDILWVVYRLFKSLEKKNTIGVVFAVVLIIVGIPFLWLVDIITLVLKDEVLWID